MEKSLKKEVFNYIIIGFFIVFIDFISYHFYYSSLSLDSSNSKRLSYITGAIISFFLNKKITFKSSKKNLSEPISFLIIYFLSFVSNSLTHDFLLNYFSGNYPFYISTLVSIIINYLGQKFIVFRNK